MRRILKLDRNPIVKSECWTSECLAIIQANTEYKSWIASHFEVYMNSDYETYFGPIMRGFRLCDFEDILSFKEIPIWKTSPEKIIDILISEINKNHYIIFFPTDYKNNRRHECIVYGYDTCNELFNIYDLTTNTEYLSFQEIELMYKFTYDSLKSCPYDIIYFKTFFPITSVYLKKDKNQDMSIRILETLRRFDYEYHGTKYITSKIDENTNKNTNVSMFSGSYCVKGVEEYIGKLFKDKQFIVDNVFTELAKKLIKSMLKLSDHRKMIYESMCWLLSIYENKDMKKTADRYKEIIDNFYCASMLSVKFARRQDWDILHRVASSLSAQYKNEQIILKEFIDYITDSIAQCYIFGER